MLRKIVILIYFILGKVLDLQLSHSIQIAILDEITFFLCLIEAQIVNCLDRNFEYFFSLHNLIYYNYYKIRIYISCLFKNSDRTRLCHFRRERR